MKKKNNKSLIINISIILVILIISYLSLKPSNPESQTDEELIKCIADKATLYVQLGCSHCRTQEELFGDNLKHINIVDCFDELQECRDAEIRGTPTWIINDEHYIGVKSIKKLKELTKC